LEVIIREQGLRASYREKWGEWKERERRDHSEREGADRGIDDEKEVGF